MTKISTTIGQMKSNANELRELNRQLKNAISQLQDSESTLCAMWEGEARDSFNRAFSNDIIQMNNFYNAIEIYAARLETAAARYSNVEGQNVEIANCRKYK